MAALRNGVLLLVWVCTSVYFNYLTPEFQLYLGVSLDITMVELVTASAYAPADQQQAALSEAQRTVESLVQITEYFADTKLNVNDLSREQQTFVLRALEAASKGIDSFLVMMPPEAVLAAREQIAEENSLNDQEGDEVGLKLLNPPEISAPPPPPPPPPQAQPETPSAPDMAANLQTEAA